MTDVPHFGGASGSTLDEARSWGKLAEDADRVSVNADVTVALPLLASALEASARAELDARRAPVFELDRRALAVDGIRCRSIATTRSGSRSSDRVPPASDSHPAFPSLR